jgi:cystathionine gamma-lyase
VKDDKNYRIGTRAVHGGVEPDPLTGAVMTPIYQTSTYAQIEPGVTKGYDYSRTNNPTREALERALASLEQADYGIAFASGMAAITAIMQLCKCSDHIICSDDVYGGTFRLFDKIFRNYQFEFNFVDTSNIKNIELALTPTTRLIWIETPTNPTLKITDIAETARLAKKCRALLVVDNTFMSPYFQSPLFHGADLVLHSTTKYISGHSDVVGGAVVTNNGDLAERLHFIQNAAGAIPGPMDCFLTLRGIKTLHLRMARHEENARKIYEYLRSQKAVKKLYYPGDTNHPNYNVQCKQACGSGAMISLDLGDLERAKKFISGLKIFMLAESLGGVESLVDHPAIMTHASIPPEDRLALGITDGFVRLSIGIEDAEDLVTDLQRGFDILG